MISIVYLKRSASGKIPPETSKETLVSPVIDGIFTVAFLPPVAIFTGKLIVRSLPLASLTTTVVFIGLPFECRFLNLKLRSRPSI